MAYRTRSARRLVRKSKKNLFATVIIIALLLYATVSWILPFFINSLGFITGTLRHEEKITQVSDQTSLAPPVLNISYEATGSSPIDIKGYASPNTKVQIYIDDELKDTVDVQSSGSFLAQNIDLNLGTNNIYGKSIDEGGESLPSKTLKIIYDQEKPLLEVSEPEDGKVIQGERKLNISGKTEPGIQVTINGSQAIVNDQGDFKFTYNLNDGENILTIKASDQVQNTTEITIRITFNP